MEARPVLIVSRDPDVLTIFEAMLEHAGFSVRRLPDPTRIIETMLAEPPALVVTNFPTVVGDVTVTELIRGEPRFADVPILNVTSHVMPFELDRAVKAGVNVSIAMPVSFEALAVEVRRQIESIRRETRFTE